MSTVSPRARLVLGLWLLFGVAAMGAVHRAIVWWAHARAEAEFERRARLVLGPLQVELDASLELTEALADVTGAGLAVSQEMFDTVAAGASRRHRQLRALAWLPRVPRGSEAAFEASLRSEFGPFHVTDLPSADTPASHIDRFPVLLTSPAAAARTVRGLDLASESRRRRTIVEAIESGEPRVSPLLELTRGGEGFLIVVPSYAAGRPHGSAAERWQALRGLAVAVYEIGGLLEIAAPAGRTWQLAIDVRHDAVPAGEIPGPGERVTGGSVWRAQSVWGAGANPLELHLVPDQAARAGQSWYLRVVTVPGASFLPSRLLPWIGAAIIAVFVGMAALLALRTMRARRLAADLQASNARLATEVTERKAQERLLKQHVALVTVSLDTMNLVAWHFDVQRGELTRSSAEGPLTTVVSPETTARWTGLFANIGEEDRERVRAYVRDLVARREERCRFEVGTTGPDGSPRRNVIVGRFEYDARGRVAAFTGLEADVTERRRAEEERRQLARHLQDAQRLESLGLLAGGVAHDFNNLIMGIMGGLGVLEECAGDDPAVRRALGLIDRGATRAAELTRQLLAYAGREQVAVGATAVGELVRDMIPLLEASASKQVPLVLEVDPATPSVEADATQLRQIVMNLVLNAAEAMSGAPGTVRITVGAEEIDRRTLAQAWPANDLPGGRYVVLRVRDTGCGMTPETRQRIFEPFFTTKFTGRGLGLAAVLGIVRAHRGAILVDSVLARGTTFTVLLPPGREDAAPTSVAAPRADSWRGRGIVLVVDDEAVAREMTADMLRSLGFDVEEATGGVQALAWLDRAAAAPAAVVLDLTMPGPSGIEVHRDIRRRHPTLPILLVSGFSEHDVRGVLEADRGTAFLQKPFRRAALAAAMRRLVGQAEPVT